MSELPGIATRRINADLPWAEAFQVETPEDQEYLDRELRPRIRELVGPPAVEVVHIKLEGERTA